MPAILAIDEREPLEFLISFAPPEPPRVKLNIVWLLLIVFAESTPWLDMYRWVIWSSSVVQTFSKCVCSCIFGSIFNLVCLREMIRPSCTFWCLLDGLWVLFRDLFSEDRYPESELRRISAVFMLSPRRPKFEARNSPLSIYKVILRKFNALNGSTIAVGSGEAVTEACPRALCS